ncbi:MAG: trimeric intracellular cation channel family protein [Muribaculaceae bacterium]|nr:trimeric intracellular cation channel family protein [Muribaculaceae bacterium]
MGVPAEETFLYIIEMIGAVAAAISGIRLAALKRFDWFGAYIVGLVTALGGGTLRDMMLGNPVFWVSSMKMFLSYFIGTALSMVVVIVFSAILVRRERALLVFDAIGLAMFTVIGIEKALADCHPMGIAIAMGLVTGAFGGVLRDILINEEPLIFRKDIYAMASLLGGVAYWGVGLMGWSAELSAFACMISCISIRMMALKFGWHLPVLRPVDKNI